VDKYLNAFYLKDYKLAYKYLSISDRSIKTQEAYLKYLEGKYKKYNLGYNLDKAFLSRCKYEIKNYRIDGNKAEVSVIFTLPDLKKIIINMLTDDFSDDFTEAFSDAFKFKSRKKSKKRLEKRIEERLIEVLDNKNLPIIKKRRVYNLIKEKNSWKIFLNFKSPEETKGLTTGAQNSKVH